MNVLIVSTLYYQRLVELLDSLTADFEERSVDEINYYVVNENYGAEQPSNVKFKHYISTSDSTDTQEMERIYNEVRTWPKFDYSIQTDEYAITILALINTELGLPGLTMEDEHKFRDKVKMKQALKDDVPTPKLYALDDVKNNVFEYPVIVKPRTFAASKGVEIMEDKETLIEFLKDKQVNYERASIDTMFDYEIEQYVSGDIYHIDGIVFDGNIKFCVASRYLGNCFNYAQGKILGSVVADDSQQEKAIALAKKVNRDLEIPNGVFHLEAIYHDDDFVFLEIGARPGGGDIVPTINLATGVDLTKEHIKCQIGIKPLDIKREKNYFGWLNFPCIYEYERSQFVKEIEMPQKKLKSLNKFKLPKIGDKATSDFVNYGNALGTFIFLSNDYEEMKADMEEIIKSYKVIIA